MYARFTMFTLGPGTRSTYDALIDQFRSALKARKGLKSVQFIGDDETGQYGTFAIWESEEDAEAASQALNPKLQESLKGLVETRSQYPLFELIEVVEPDK